MNPWTKISDKAPVGEVLVFDPNGGSVIRIKVAENAGSFLGAYTHWQPFTPPVEETEEDKAWKAWQLEHSGPGTLLSGLTVEAAFRSGYRAAKREVEDLRKALDLRNEVEGKAHRLFTDALSTGERIMHTPDTCNPLGFVQLLRDRLEKEIAKPKREVVDEAKWQEDWDNYYNSDDSWKTPTPAMLHKLGWLARHRRGGQR